MPKITYIEHAGRAHVVDAPVGGTVMERGRDACACSTCHVHVDPDRFDRQQPMDSMEEDMLDFAPGEAPDRSRLSRQVRVTADLDGLVVSVPEEQA